MSPIAKMPARWSELRVSTLMAFFSSSKPHSRWVRASDAGEESEHVVGRHVLHHPVAALDRHAREPVAVAAEPKAMPRRSSCGPPPRAAACARPTRVRAELGRRCTWTRLVALRQVHHPVEAESPPRRSPAACRGSRRRAHPVVHLAVLESVRALDAEPARLERAQTAAITTVRATKRVPAAWRVEAAVLADRSSTTSRRVELRPKGLICSSSRSTSSGRRRRAAPDVVDGLVG